MITYKKKEYPVRGITMTSKETGEVSHLIADQTLYEAMKENSPHLKGSKERAIDETIYFFVEDGVLSLTAEEICAKHLDQPFEFISED